MRIAMRHGAGGTDTARLIDDVFLAAFGQPGDGTRDAALVEGGSRLAFTADGFVVRPLFFPGGDIGRLAVCGTVNDLLTAGAEPRYLSAAFILEEGLELDELRRVAASMAATALETGVRIVTGDTKVVEGNGGLYIATSGIGDLNGAAADFRDAREGDAVLVTGTLGDHHACIMSARMGVENGIRSDAAPLCAMVSGLRAAGVPINGMRDITRGGLATVLCEITRQFALGIYIREEALPVSPEVAGLCGMLGLEPLYMGCEGNMLMIVPNERAGEALDIIRASPYGQNAAHIGVVGGEGARLITRMGGQRMLRPLSGESLPRIC